MLRPRRLAALASICGLLMAGAAPAVAAPFAPSGGLSSWGVTNEETITAPIVIATYNIRHALSDAVAVSDIKTLADAGVGVIGLQEMGSRSRRDAVRKRLVDCSECEFDAFMPDGTGPSEVPILYRSANFRLLSTGSRKVSDATYVGRRGAGPSRITAKYLNYVQLRHRITGQEMYVINSHTVASVQARDGGPDHRYPKRLQLYRQHMNGLKALITKFKETGAAVFTTGDFNVNYRRDSVLQSKRFPYYSMRQVRVFASYKFLGIPEQGTHRRRSSTNDARLIDYVSSLRHAAVVPKAQTILQEYRSDHRPVRVRYAITKTITPPDTAAPVLSAFRFTPQSVDVNRAAMDVVVTARTTDATGVKAPTLMLTSDSTPQTAGFGRMTRISGTATDAVYSRTVSIPATAAPGSWTVRIYPLGDTLGNSDNLVHRHPQKLVVTNASG